MPPDQPSGPLEHDAQQRDSLLGVGFPTTNWSMVLRTHRNGAKAMKAMNDLCRRYWYPIYAYLRCRGFERADAQDLTQSFFLHAVTGGLFQNAVPAHGRLRSFLLGALNRHVADHLRHQGAQKRGGRAIVLPLEVESAEDKFSNEPADHRDPEQLYLAAWARSLIDTARQRLRKHLEKKQQGDLYEKLQGVIELEEGQTPYRELAAELHTSEAALRILIFRLRRRFGKLLREEVARTVETPVELEEELAWLSRMLRKP